MSRRQTPAEIFRLLDPRRQARRRKPRINLKWAASFALTALVFAGIAWLSLPHMLNEIERADARSPSVASSPPVPGILTARVVRVIDGDGLVLRSGEEIRLGDFDAPEWNEPGGRAAKDALSALVYGKTIACTPCEGARRAGQCRSYDRIIATCRLDGRRLGDLMRARGVREGGR